MRFLAYLQSLAWCIVPVLGNVEKTIFLAPEAIHIPQQHPNLDDLSLEALSPLNATLRRQLPAAFPKPGFTQGKEAWFLLNSLKQHQRYEVRICWAATVSQHSHSLEMRPTPHFPNTKRRTQQPTSFILNTYELAEVFNTPELITSLAVFSESRQSSRLPARDSGSPLPNEWLSSALFLRILAAADYYTTNQTLMQNVPPVNVDISM